MKYIEISNFNPLHRHQSVYKKRAESEVNPKVWTKKN